MYSISIILTSNGTPLTLVKFYLVCRLLVNKYLSLFLIKGAVCVVSVIGLDGNIFR